MKIYVGPVLLHDAGTNLDLFKVSEPFVLQVVAFGLNNVKEGR